MSPGQAVGVIAVGWQGWRGVHPVSVEATGWPKDRREAREARTSDTPRCQIAPRGFWGNRDLVEPAASAGLRDGVRNILGSVGIGVEHHHAQRLAALPIYPIGYGGFIVGAVGVTPARRRRIGACAPRH